MLTADALVGYKVFHCQHPSLGNATDPISASLTLRSLPKQESAAVAVTLIKSEDVLRTRVLLREDCLHCRS